jgi:fatty-acyl-CoA synthase
MLTMLRGSGAVGETYAEGLERNSANYAALTPVSFLNRSALAFPDKTAVIDGSRRLTYQELHLRARRLASALTRRGIGKGDTVAMLAPNIPAMIEAHFGVPMAGAVLNCLNIRLDAATIAFCLSHGEAKLVLVDRQYLMVVVNALSQVSRRLAVIVVNDPDAEATEFQDYEAFLAGGDPQHVPPAIADEWSPISLGYTSGTTGDPKGVVCHHRGAYLNALGNALEARLEPTSV